MLQKIKWSLLCFSIALASLKAHEPTTFIEDRSTLAILTPSLAERKTQKLRLANGLEVLLISDPHTLQSGAALAVKVGSWEDPQDRPGMAHFIEHLLFMGTEKYPEENAYQRYIDEYGGMQNAFTMDDKTVYLFSINNEGFSEALDRFAHFFIAPLFNPSGVAREAKAVHSEYCKNLSSDTWRAWHVKKELANPQHPFHHFSIGNEETLAQISQEELKTWYSTHYSANIMHLVVYSSLPLPVLEKDVSSIFSQIENKHLIPSSYTESLIPTSSQGTLVSITPYKEKSTLELCWEFPSSEGDDLETHSRELMAYTLGHEGETSLLAQLKREKLAHGLAAYPLSLSKDTSLFILSIQLTDQGVQSYKKVISRCFEAIASIRQSGLPLYLFNEYNQLKKLRYCYQERPEIFSLVKDYVLQITEEPLETFPQKTVLATEYSPSSIEKILNSLSPRTCHYTLIASPEKSQIFPDKKEKWFASPYAQRSFSSETLTQWESASPHKEMCIPAPNHFIPYDFRITSSENPSPSLVMQSPSGSIYFSPDHSFLTPEISWTFSFKTPLIYAGDPRLCALADLYCYAVKQQWSFLTYEAEMGGLTYALYPTHHGVKLKIQGFNQKASLFLDKLLASLKTLSFTKQDFLLYKEILQQSYQKNAHNSSFQQSRELLWNILYRDYASIESKLQALEKLTYEELLFFCHNVWKESFVEGMLYGNLSYEESLPIAEKVIKIASSPYPPEKHPEVALATFPSEESPYYLYQTSFLPAHALILATDCGTFSFKRRAAQEILAKGLEEPFYTELRTQQQTAYLLGNWTQEIERRLYSFFAIQSHSHEPRDLLARSELFLETSLQSLADKTIPKQRFEAIRLSLILQLQNQHKNLISKGELLHLLAFAYDGDFEWIEKRLKGFEELTYEEFLQFSQEMLGKGNRQRLAVGIYGSPDNPFLYQLTTPEKIRKQILYKGRKEKSL